MNICAKCKHSFSSKIGFSFEIDSCIKFDEGADYVTGRIKYKKCAEIRTDPLCTGYEERPILEPILSPKKLNIFQKLWTAL